MDEDIEAALMRAGHQINALQANERRLIDELAALRKDAERYRHCKAHGYPMSGPQCIAWTYDGRMVFGDTPEAAIDNAMAYRVPAVRAA
jgi:hypothetical protein